jgi:RimJ/RimL family protein N-acetyltransferase
MTLLAKPAILVEVPRSFRTERLLVRAAEPGDGPELNAAVCESLPELEPWLEWAQGPPSLDDSEAFVRDACAQWYQRSLLHFHVYRRNRGTLLGCVGLVRPDWAVPAFEIGYWLRTRGVGHGYMTEAVQGLVRLAFEDVGARRLEIRCDARNVRSVAVAERCSFHLEGRLRCHRRAPDGQVADTLVFGRLRELESAAGARK